MQSPQHEASKEETAAELVTRIARILAENVGPVWHIGDGHGGWVRSVMEAAFDEAGLPRRLPTDPSDGPPTWKRGNIPARVRRQVLERDAYRCRRCGDWHDLEIDHVVPVSLGGSSHPENLQTLCHDCHVMKSSA